MSKLYNISMSKKTVVVGMSGGVDSSVAALLLKRQGYNVIGLFMKNWEESDDDGACTAETDFSDVRRVCSVLDIPYYTVNFSKEYMDRVFKYFLSEYEKGRTPNPDVLCNREIKFGPFKEYAKNLGADFIATGHYCKIEHESGFHHLMKAKDQNKDQTYFLNQVTQPQLENVLFPLADLDKSEVRKIADEYNLSTAEKKDSTGICFIGERNFRQFLMNYIPAKEGEIKTYDGRVLGKHYGLMYYTIGQRRGLDIGGQKGDDGRWFVIEKDLKNNVLYVAHGEEDKLYSKGLIMSGLNLFPKTPNENSFDCTAKFRYRQEEQKVRVNFLDDGTCKVDFYERQRAITEGQYCVLYLNEYCLGGGVIEKAIF